MSPEGVCGLGLVRVGVASGRDRFRLVEDNQARHGPEPQAGEPDVHDRNRHELGQCGRGGDRERERAAEPCDPGGRQNVDEGGEGLRGDGL